MSQILRLRIPLRKALSQAENVISNLPRTRILSTPKVYARPSQRCFSSSVLKKAAFAETLPTQPTVLISNPVQADLDREELDIELLPLEQVKLEITDRAAEVCTSHV